MKYLLINPLSGGSSGIDNYTKALLPRLGAMGMSYDYYCNEGNLSPANFRRAVLQYVTSKYGYEDVIIEAPEAKAATLLLPRQYKTHIRLHCPLAIAQKYDGHDVNEDAFSNELRVMYKANLVSSPSHALLEHLSPEFNPAAAAVFKNPVDPSIRMHEFSEKVWDVVFLGRFQTLKGVEYLNPILERLPKHFRVVLVGRGATDYPLSKAIRCYVETHEQIEGPARFTYVGQSKVLLLLSKFENCSMVILESIASGTIVDCWNVGGNAEIAPAPVLNAFDFEDIDAIATHVKGVCDPSYQYPSLQDFHRALDRVQQDFESGLSSVVERLVRRKQWKSLDMRHSIQVSAAEPIDLKVFQGKKFLGFSISNEHIQEMWEPIAKALSMDRRYICLRQQGHRKLFDIAHEIESKSYASYDWIRHPERLFKNIENFKPDFLLFHNGLHPRYQSVLTKVKQLGIPVVYTELGWFPQKDHIYFDEWGTNGASRLASLDFKAMCGYRLPEIASQTIAVKKVALLVTQLENDTNIIVNSPLFRSNENFVRHVISQIPEDWEIVIRPHPLDKNADAFAKFTNERISVNGGMPLEEALENSGAVIALNSTVLLQALAYQVNIYTFAKSLLDNKGVAITCLDGNLESRWRDNLTSDMVHRVSLMKAFEARQINVRHILDLDRAALSRQFGLAPLARAAARGVIRRSNGASQPKPVGEKMLQPVPPSPQAVVHLRGRKLRKLRRNPILFIRDSRFMRFIRSLGS